MSVKKSKRIKILLIADAIILICVLILSVVSLIRHEKRHKETTEEIEKVLAAKNEVESSEPDSTSHNTNDKNKMQEDPTDKEVTGPGSNAQSSEEPKEEEAKPTPTEAADIMAGLDGLSADKVGWCFERKSGNEPAGTYEPFDITQYGAFFRNKKAKKKDKVIYFSFDCGYEYGFTEKILDVLKAHDVKATFFVTKSFMDTDADLAKRMKEEGHIVGNHTLHHPSLPEKSAEEVRDEVKGMEELFKELTGYDLDKFIRPPMGEYSEKVLKELQNMGYTTIFWSIAYGDYDVDNQPGKEYVVDHFKKYHHNGAITLTHTVSKSNAEALDEVLTYLEKEGYRFGSLEELREQQMNGNKKKSK